MTHAVVNESHDRSQLSPCLVSSSAPTSMPKQWVSHASCEDDPQHDECARRHGGYDYFDNLFLRLRDHGVPLPVAVERVATALDGKPLSVGKKKPSKKERDRLFWSSNVVKNCPAESWNADTMVLALARYVGQEAVAAEGLMARVAREAPGALICAVRYSRVVLNHTLSTTSRTGPSCVRKRCGNRAMLRTRRVCPGASRSGRGR